MKRSRPTLSIEDQRGRHMKSLIFEWHLSDEEIADFLSEANPNWSRAVLVDMMNADFSATTNEVVARLRRNWEDDLLAFDGVYQYIVKISDALSDGMIERFPGEFAFKSTTTH
jgi:hypothetical protein